jgi:hypothetical protein
MQGQKNSLSTFNFNMKQKVFLTSVLCFFVPIVLGYILIEVLVLQIPFNYKNTASFFNSENDKIETIILGSSQMNNAVNPKYLDKTAINFASTSQHHDLDYNIYNQTKSKLNNLKYVVIELSYAHLELPHNGKYFWKNSVYLKYYGVNAFNRNTYFKDRLIYLSNPDFYSRSLYDYNILNKQEANYNSYGFDENNFQGSFKNLAFSEEKIAEMKIKVRKTNQDLQKENTVFLFKMLDDLESNKYNVIIATLPVYKTYVEYIDTSVVKRRDSILEVINKKYKNVSFLKEENDTTLFTVTDFINHNHLNPNGAEKFTKKLNTHINTLKN